MKKIGLSLRVEAARERRDCIDQAWYGLLISLDLWPVPLPNLAPEAAFGLVEDLALDGVILTGGNDVAEAPGGRCVAVERDRFEHALLDACSERSLPVLGVCRGLQKLVLYHGGAVRAVSGHVAARHRLHVEPACALPLCDRAEVNSFHDFGVMPEDVCKPLRPVAKASDGTVEAVAHESLPQWAIMWHPERPPKDPADARLLRALFVRSDR